MEPLNRDAGLLWNAIKELDDRTLPAYEELPIPDRECFWSVYMLTLRKMADDPGYPRADHLNVQHLRQYALTYWRTHVERWRIEFPESRLKRLN